MHDVLFQGIDGKTDELVELTRELIRIPTVNPPGDAYTECAEFLGRRLAARGFRVEYLRAEGSRGDSARYPRTNMIARIEGNSPGPCLHFNSHIDVVPAGQGWTIDPFAADVRDGRVYGRGSCDMKGGLAASVIAVEALLESGIRCPGAIEISGTVDEESGGFGGVAWLAQRGYFSRPRVDHVIIPEPLNVDRICLGHRGVWWAEVETFGRIAHGSMPFLGECAVRHMGAVLARIETELLPKLRSRTTGMPVVPDGARSSTLNINAIHGGLADAPVVQAVHRAIREVLDVEAQHIVSPGTYDQKHIVRLGRLRDCIAYGPGILDLAHQPDEYVEIDHMVQSAKVMAVAALDLLGAQA